MERGQEIFVFIVRTGEGGSHCSITLTLILHPLMRVFISEIVIITFPTNNQTIINIQKQAIHVLRIIKIFSIAVHVSPAAVIILFKYPTLSHSLFTSSKLNEKKII